METSPSEIDHFITVFQNASSLEEKLQLFCERDDVQSFIQENLGREEMFKWREIFLKILLFSDKKQ